MYAELWQQWNGTDNKLNAEGRPGSDLVGTAIADAIENRDTPLRVPVGADAEMIFSARRHFDDARVRGRDAKNARSHLVSAATLAS